MLLTEHLVQGVDVWINTPRRPWEASGTSGMKVLVNGGINLSELDGWWAEAYTPEVGWALGRRPGARRRSGLGRCRGRRALRPARTRGHPGVLRARRQRHSHRLGRADAGEHGAPDAALFRQPQRCANTPSSTTSRPPPPTVSARPNNGAVGKQIVDWQRAVDEKWAELRFGEVKVEASGASHVFEVELFLGDLDPDAVRVELYADGIAGGSARAAGDELGPPDAPARRRATSTARRCLPSVRRADYTARVIPHRDGVAVPWKSAHILWQR